MRKAAMEPPLSVVIKQAAWNTLGKIGSNGTDVKLTLVDDDFIQEGIDLAARTHKDTWV